MKSIATKDYDIIEMKDDFEKASVPLKCQNSKRFGPRLAGAATRESLRARLDWTNPLS